MLNNLEIATDFNTPAYKLSELAVNTSDKRILDSIASNPNTPISTLIEVAGKYVEGLQALANNPDIDKKLLEYPQIIDAICLRLFENNIYYWEHHLPEKFLKTASTSSILELRNLVASNPNAPQVILEQLAEDSVSYVREGVAQNQNASSITLDLLSRDLEYSIRKAVASHPHSNEDTLERLANDVNPQVRLAAAKNKNANTKTLKRLIDTDEDSDVRWQAFLNIKINLFTKAKLLTKFFWNWILTD